MSIFSCLPIQDKMPGDPEEDDENWFRPVWETEDDASLEPPGARRARQPVAEPDYRHPLLAALARAQDAAARLETSAENASGAIAEGLRARMAYREAAGWLSQAHVWIHPHDLALRDRGLTGSFGAAFRAAPARCGASRHCGAGIRLRGLAFGHSR